MNKINIAELLKDCPKGIELDSTIVNGLYFDEVTFDEVTENNLIKCYTKFNSTYNTIYFYSDGSYLNHTCSKCVIFPKGKTTWEGFVPPCRFKDGDIVATNNGSWIGIVVGGYENELIPTYCVIKDNAEFEAYFNNKRKWAFDRLATEEEKQILFKAIKDNGYKWNADTKTLEELPKFKPGDVLVSNLGNIVLLSHIDSENIVHYHCIMPTIGSFRIEENTAVGIGKYYDCVLANGQQRQRMYDTIKSSGYKYNQSTNKLEKLYEPKFKVGDRVKSIYNNNQYDIIGLTDTRYTLVEVENKFKYTEPIIEDKNWELVPKKFDINTLVPFDKVLVRQNNSGIWGIDLFGFYNEGYYHTTGNCIYVQCVPYEQNEHLLGKIDDCDEYYKTWE